jgi:hypothetical protein
MKKNQCAGRGRIHDGDPEPLDGRIKSMNTKTNRDDNHVDAKEVVTPTRIRTWKRFAREELARLRREAREIRQLRASTRILDIEDAEDRLSMLIQQHANVRSLLRRIANATVVKYANVSPAAAERLARRARDRQ